MKTLLKKLVFSAFFMIFFAILSGNACSETFTGSLGSDAYEDWNIHKFTLSADGALTLEVTVSATLSLGYQNHSCLIIYDSDGTTQVWAGDGPYGPGGTTTNTVGPAELKAGTYSLKVWESGGSSGTYTIVTSLAESTYSNDTEPNDETSQAQPATLANGLEGHVGYYGGGGGTTEDDFDWWSISIPSSGKLTLEVLIDSTLSLSYQNHNCISIYESDGTTRFWAGNGPYGPGGTTAQTIGPLDIEAGTYYIQVWESGGSYGGYSIKTTLSTEDETTTTVSGETSTTTSAPGAGTTTTTSVSGDVTSTTTTTTDDCIICKTTSECTDAFGSGWACVSDCCENIVPDDECTVSLLLGEDNPRLETLRRFRDEVLNESAMGKKLIDIYYNSDASLTEILEKHPAVRKTAKSILETLVPAMEMILD